MAAGTARLDKVSRAVIVLTVGSIHDPSPSHFIRTVPHCTTKFVLHQRHRGHGRTGYRSPEVPEAPFYGARGQYRFPLAPAPRIPHRLIGIPLAVSTRPFGLVARFGGREQRTLKHRRSGSAQAGERHPFCTPAQYAGCRRRDGSLIGTHDAVPVHVTTSLSSPPALMENCGANKIVGLPVFPFLQPPLAQNHYPPPRNWRTKWGCCGAKAFIAALHNRVEGYVRVSARLAS